MSNIVSLLIEKAEQQGETIAFMQNYRTLSYRQLLNLVKITASKLERKGIRQNDRVLMFVPMSIELYVYVLAVWYRGASAVFIDAWAGTSRIEQALKTVPCTAFIGSPKAHLLRVISKEIRKIKVHLWGVVTRYKVDISRDLKPVDTTLNDTALVTFTTGSTGVPKAANRTHGFLLSQHAVLKKQMEPQRGDIECICLPVFVLNCLASGNTAFIPPVNPAKPHKFKPDILLKSLKEKKCTTIIASPVFFEKLAEYCMSKKAVPGIHRAFLGGAPVFVSLAKKIMNSFKNTDVEIVYGSTEAEPIAYIKAKDLCEQSYKKASSGGLLAGKPSPDIKIRIIAITDGPIGTITSDEFNRISCDNTKTGEIAVSGEHVLKEYLNCPEAQRENKFCVGEEVWHRTGDAGYLDADGNLYLMGRVSNRIKAGGKNIYQLAAEQEICECDQIRIGTVIEIDNKIFCAVELHETALISNSEILRMVQKYGVESLDKIIRLRIPRDPRHHSKIDYDRLRLILVNKKRHGS